MRKRVYIAVLFFTILFAFSATAATDRLLSQIDSYMAQIKTLEASFVQLDSTGAERYGKLYVKKPQRLRLQYEGHDQEIVIFKDGLLLHYNKALDEANYLPNDRLMLQLLASKGLNLQKNAKITHITKRASSAEVSFILKSDTSNRLIVMTFGQHPFALNSITVHNGDDIVSIHLLETKVNTPLPSHLFNTATYEQKLS